MSYRESAETQEKRAGWRMFFLATSALLVAEICYIGVTFYLRIHA